MWCFAPFIGLNRYVHVFTGSTLTAILRWLLRAKTCNEKGRACTEPTMSALPSLYRGRCAGNGHRSKNVVGAREEEKILVNDRFLLVRLVVAGEILLGQEMRSAAHKRVVLRKYQFLLGCTSTAL